MKLKYRRIAFIMAVLLLLNVTPVWGAERTTVNAVIADYMGARTMALVFGETDVLNESSVVGIVADEDQHYETLKEEELQVVASTYEIISTESYELEVEVVLEETIYYLQDWKINSEVVEHMVSLIYDEENVPVVVSDSYYEEYSGFISASFVNPYAVVLTDEAGSDECIVRVAGTQVGYLEKETNSNLDSFTANSGDGNYTKYGKWYGSNGVAWCAIFVSWCADQANVSTSIIKKTASCDTSMNFFKNAGKFQASKAYGGSYTPKVGDIFFYGSSASNATHTGIVVGVSSTQITAIHGNSQDQVRKSTYSLTNTKLLGFGTPNYASDTHSYEYGSTSTGHTGTCSVCDHTTALTAHTFKYSIVGTIHRAICSICGYSTTASHTYVMNSNSSAHWQGCNKCGYKTSSVAHTYEWNYNIINHWKECNVCGYEASQTTHTWIHMGSYYKCSGCGAMKSQSGVLQ